MKELTLREIQLGELEVLKKLADICQKNNLKYFIAYGTLLGAVRHKGFIPWDDDVDVIMPRDDYNQLVEWCRNHSKELEHFVLKHYSLDKKYIYPIARLCDTRYQIDYANASDYGLGLFVDIYPFDECGNSMEETETILKSLRNLRACVAVAGNPSFLPSRTAFWRNIIKFPLYCYAKMRGINNLIQKLDIKAQGYKGSQFLYCLVWGRNMGHLIEKSMFENPGYVDFEGCQFPTLQDYDKWLRSSYGDYMIMPPEEEQVAHHYYKAYLKEEGTTGRIKKEITEIDYGKSKQFFQNRAGKFMEDNPYSVTMYQDDHKELVQERNKRETQKLLSFLHPGSQSRVLDIACGIGRWADALPDIIEEYCGIDFSDELIEIAKKRNNRTNFSFLQGSATEIEKALAHHGKGKYNTVLMIGILMYINDNDMMSALNQVIRCCEKHATVCIREPIGLSERLTLKDFFSDELKDNYNAIYRTREENMHFFNKTFLKEGFSITNEGFLFDEDALNNRKETAQYYYILER